MENKPAGDGRPKIFYGWIVAVAGALAIFAGTNFQYTFGVFVKPLEDTFGWSRAAISGCVSVRNLVSLIYAPMVGAWCDKYGPRRFILIGLFLVGLSYLVVSRITRLWELYFLFSLVVGVGLTSVYIPTVAAVTRWFGPKSTLANGIVMSGFSIVQIILPPVATFLILNYGLSMCFIVMGVGVWVIGITAWCFVRTPPTPIHSEEKSGNSPAPPAGSGDDTITQVLRYPAMWLLMGINATAYLNYQMAAIHVVPAAIHAGIGPEAAALILTLGGIGNTTGRIAMGALANRVGTKSVLTLCLAIQALCLFTLASAKDLHVFYISSVVFGFVYGGMLPVMPALCAGFFGTKIIASIFSMINLSQNAGAAIGPLLAGYIFDTTRSYFAAFLSAGMATAIIFLLSLRLKPPRRP